MPTKTKSTAATKKVATKPKAKTMPVMDVPSEVAFWTIDGAVFHSLAELADGLLVMAPRVYRYHADKDHQDFANWVGSIFHDKPLAALLKKATTTKAAEKVIRTHLKASK
ncbi:MAG: hypothetical protein RLZZ360_956 [Candidatus Parcubacteria bacterium]|jgi:hypothetical protein